jgi:hypothetical protein
LNSRLPMPGGEYLLLKTIIYWIFIELFHWASLLVWFNYNIKQLLDEVFVISEIIKVEVSVISRSRRLQSSDFSESKF